MSLNIRQQSVNTTRSFLFVLLTLQSHSVISGTSLSPSQNRSQTSIAELLREIASLIQQENLSDARVLAQKAVALAPTNADAHNLFGIILDQQKQYKEAEHEYRLAVKL